MAGASAGLLSWPIWLKAPSGYRYLPVPSGVSTPLMGPTAGYLFGFVAAAVFTGWFAERGWDRSVPRLFVVMAIGHIIILAAGFGWLALGMKLGFEKAWLVGVAPFIAGSARQIRPRSHAGARCQAHRRSPHDKIAVAVKKNRPVLPGGFCLLVGLF